MTARTLVLMFVGLALMTQVRPVTAQLAGNAAVSSTSRTWVVPRTPWGEPDLQGLWPANDMQGTPYERPAELGTRSTLTEAELAERQRARQRQVESDSQQFVQPGRTAGIGGPSHWAAGERGNPTSQTSLVVDPPNGRIPAMTEEGKQLFARAKSTYYYDFPDAVVAHPFETFEDLGPYDRCITRGVLSSMLPTAYNMGTQIFQFPGHVVIQNEMIHEVRVIPTDGRAHISDKIRQYMGDSRGHWEGDTLVVETTNFNAKVGLTRNGNTLLASPDLRLVERLTRIGPDTLRYEATVHDSKTWTRPWTVSLPLTQHPEYQMFEYACHEGNYSVRNILSAERTAEKGKAGSNP